MAVTLQNCLDASSGYLGEGSTPAAQVAQRTMYANQAKKNIRDLRNWSWEGQDGDPVNFVYTPATLLYTYTLTPSAGAIKNKDALYWVKFTDQNSTVTYMSPVDQPTMNAIVLNNISDSIAYWLKGNDKLGYSLVINGGAVALPTLNVSNAITYRYWAKEPDFVLTTDTTAIPKEEAIAWYIAAKVLYGYREQAQYQLAMAEYQNAITDLSMTDQKPQPYQDSRIKTFRESSGASSNFKTYY